MILDVVLFVVAGLVGGAVNAAAGGAKLFVFPMLIATGLSPLAANVTFGVAMWPAQMSAVWVYRRELRAELRTRLWQMLPALAGSLVGALLMVNSGEAAFTRVVPVFLIIAVVTILLGPKLAVLMRRALPGRRMAVVSLVLLALIGVYGGYFAAGMGFMLLAVLSAPTGAPLGRVNGAKNLFAMAIQSVAVVPMLLSGLVDWLAAGCVLVGGVAGGAMGASLTRRLPEVYVRIGVAVLGLVLTASFLLS